MRIFERMMGAFGLVKCHVCDKRYTKLTDEFGDICSGECYFNDGAT